MKLWYTCTLRGGDGTHVSLGRGGLLRLCARVWDATTLEATTPSDSPQQRHCSHRCKFVWGAEGEVDVLIRNLVNSTLARGGVHWTH